MATESIKIVIEAENQTAGPTSDAIKSLKELDASLQQSARTARETANEKKKYLEEVTQALNDANKAAGRGDDGRFKVNEVTKALRDEVDAAKAASKAADELARALEKQSANKSREVASAIREETKARQDATRAAKEQAAAIEAANAKNVQMAGMGRNAGIGLTVAGGAGLAASNNAANVADTQDSDEAKLSAMFAKIGDTDAAIFHLKDNLKGVSFDAAFPDEGKLNAVAAGLAGFGVKANQVEQILPGLIGQSRLYNKSIEEVSESFGRAFASGNLGTLRRSGIVVSDADIDRIHAISDEGQRQAAIFDVVKASLDKYALSMTQGMSAGEIAAARQQLAIQQMNHAIGEGSSIAKQQGEAIVGTFAQLISFNPDLAKTAGYILAIGSAGVTGAGGIITLAAQTFLAVKGAREFVEWIGEIRKAKIGEATTATATATAEVTANESVTASLVTLEEKQTEAANGAIEIGTAAETASTSVQDAVNKDIAAYDALIEKQNEAAAGAKNVGVASEEGAAVAPLAGGAGAAAAGGGIAAGAAGAAIGAIPALTVAAAVQGASDAVSLARTAGSDASDQAVKDQGNGSLILNGGLLQQASLLLTGKGVGDLADSVRGWFGGKAKPDAPTPTATPKPTAPAAPAAVTPATPTPAVTAPTLGVSSESSALVALSGQDRVDAISDEENPVRAQIQELQRQKSALTGRANKSARESLEKQIQALEGAAHSWDETHKVDLRNARREEEAAKKAGRDAERENKVGEREQTQAEKDAAEIASLERDNADSGKASQLKRQIKAATKAGDAGRVRLLTVQLELIKADEKRADELGKAALEKDTAHRAALIKEANLRYQGAVQDANEKGDDAAESVRGSKGNNDAYLRSQLSFNRNNYAFRPFGQGPFIAPGISASSGGNAYIPLPSDRSPVDRDSAAYRGGNVAREGTARGSVTRTPRGFKVKFEDIEIPDTGMAAQRGRRRT